MYHPTAVPGFWFFVFGCLFFAPWLLIAPALAVVLYGFFKGL